MKSLLFISIGSGLGHLTRTIAVAKRIKQLENEDQIIFFTITNAEAILRENGYICYHMPPFQEVSDTMNASAYNNMMGYFLEGIIERHFVQSIIFDGSFPYECLVRILVKRYDLNRIWIKREGDRKGFDTSSLWFYQKRFDKILIPDELGLYTHRAYASNEFLLPPIICLEDKEVLEYNTVRNTFKVKKEDIVWYLQLRKNERNQRNNLLNRIVSELLCNQRNQIFGARVSQESIAQQFHDKIIWLDCHPNAKVFRGVDYAITAAGYNTVHELAYLGVPAILVPDESVRKDDQQARAKRLEALGYALVFDEKESLGMQIQLLMDQGSNMRRRMQEATFVNGANLAAIHVINQKERE